MVTSVFSSNSAIELNDGAIRSRLPLRNDELDELRLELTQVLQTTLDVGQLLELFFTRIQRAVNARSLRYVNEELRFNTVLGRESAHKCDYCLRTAESDMGQLIFSRNKRFSENDMATLETLMGTLAFPLRNALSFFRVQHAALTDPLTQVGNRAAFNQNLQREAQLAKRYSQDLSLLVLDIDYFKQINDQFGHSAGDKVLIEVAALLSESCRDTDLVFRYGGEEFTVLLNNTDSEGASITAERLCDHFRSSTFQTHAGNIPITLSIGVATLQFSEDTDTFFNRADSALYEAKRTGRNRFNLAPLS